MGQYAAYDGAIAADAAIPVDGGSAPSAIRPTGGDSDPYRRMRQEREAIEVTQLILMIHDFIE